MCMVQPNDSIYPLSTGTLLSERYEVIDILGHGGYGRVYKVKDRKLHDKIWAVKEIYSGKETTENLCVANENFLKEAAILCNLNHLNIPQVVDYFSSGFRHYIVMEYISGKTLYEKYKSEKRLWKENEIISFAMEMCHVLEYLHNHLIIFRDLKPQNIMINDKGNVKLIDFGIARHFKVSQSTDTINIGTPGYAAPEQYGARGGSDSRTDIYSLGVILHYLSSGEDPLEREEPFKFCSIKSVNPEISDGLISIINKCINLHKNERFQNINEVLIELKNINKENAVSLSVEFPIKPLNKDFPEKSQKNYPLIPPPSGSKIVIEQLSDDKFIIDIPHKGIKWWLMAPAAYLSLFSLFNIFAILCILGLENFLKTPYQYVFGMFFLILMSFLGSLALFQDMFSKSTIAFTRDYVSVKNKWFGLINTEKKYSIDTISEFNFENKFYEKKLYFYHNLDKVNLTTSLKEIEYKWLSQELNKILKFLKEEE